MGYFDGITDGMFKKGANGEDLYYPWGMLAKGYVLESAEEKEKVRSFVKKSFIIALPVLFILTFIKTWIGFAACGFVTLMFWYMTKQMMKGHARTDEKLRYMEGIRNSAKSHNPTILIILAAFSAILALCGFLMIFDGEIIIGTLSLALFGFGAVMLGYMAKLNKELNKS